MESSTYFASNHADADSTRLERVQDVVTSFTTEIRCDSAFPWYLGPTK